MAPRKVCTHKQHLGPPARLLWAHGPCGDAEVPWAARPRGWASIRGRTHRGRAAAGELPSLSGLGVGARLGAELLSL